MHRSNKQCSDRHRRTLLTLAFLAPLCGHLTACSTAPPGPASARVNHPVFFSLNDPADAAALIADCNALLPGIPGVVTYSCGTPLDTGRDTVNLNFDVGLVIGFESIAAYEKYITHPDHEELVARWGDKFAALTIYDVLDETDE